METTRRAFLLGRRPPETPWAAFLRRLRRACAGELRVQDGGTGAAAPQAPQASWRPLSSVDVRVARELCAEYGVIMALAETRGDASGRPCLWISPRSLTTLQCLDDGAAAMSAPMPARWRAAPGATMAMLADAGLAQFAALPGDLTVAGWLAARGHMNAHAGLASPPGLIAVDVMLADGALETLGPFGASGGVALRSGTGQALSPTWYTLSTRAGAAWCRAQAAWPARYRLDALTPPAPDEANLAGLLAGHEGALAWVESVVLHATAASSSYSCTSVPPIEAAAPSTPYPAEARALDAYIKDAFDPAGLYPDAPLP